MGKNVRFTLIEFLIVISIIAILTAILLPALNKAKQKAVEISCLALLKQQIQSVISYADDNKGRRPPSGENEGYTTHTIFSGINCRWWGLGLLYRNGYIRQKQAFYCPSNYEEEGKSPSKIKDNFYRKKSAAERWDMEGNTENIFCLYNIRGNTSGKTPPTGWLRNDFKYTLITCPFAVKNGTGGSGTGAWSLHFMRYPVAYGDGSCKSVSIRNAVSVLTVFLTNPYGDLAKEGIWWNYFDQSR